MAVALIVLSQWLGTSLWFSTSGAADGLKAHLGIASSAFGWLVAATQLGFIVGTSLFALTGVADRVSASRLFAASCAAGALANAVTIAPDLGYGSVWALRFTVGLCLAGIYPLGMKMIVTWVGRKPAAALGWLVGMLTLGTAMPYGLRAAGASWSWQAVIAASSGLALVGGAAVLWIGDGHRVASSVKVVASKMGTSAARSVFAVPAFRASAFGYFGHMWELYAFWSVVPWLCRPLSTELAQRYGDGTPSAALLSFTVIAAGCVGCIAGGHLGQTLGSARVAGMALAGSGLMCVFYPAIPEHALSMKLIALLFWGLCVVADSPQFSALSARNAPGHLLGSALAIQNGIGFLITVFSILMMSYAYPALGAKSVWLLAAGPAFGLWSMRSLWKQDATS